MSSHKKLPRPVAMLLLALGAILCLCLVPGYLIDGDFSTMAFALFLGLGLGFGAFVTFKRWRASKAPVATPPASASHASSVPQPEAQLTMIVPSSYVVIDVETTGLSADTDQIIEIAALRVEQHQITDRFSRLVQPGKALSQEVVRLTGITNAMLDAAPPIKAVLPEFLRFVGDHTIVGHNVRFDVDFIAAACRRQGLSFAPCCVDTLRLSHALFPKENGHKLTDLVKRFQITAVTSHRALADAESTHLCLQHMIALPAYRQKYLPHDHTPARLITTTRTEFDEHSPLFGKTFAFTGQIPGYSRDWLMQQVVDHGGHCKDGVSRAVTHLVIADPSAPKTTKVHRAEELIQQGYALTLVSGDQFMAMLEQ